MIIKVTQEHIDRGVRRSIRACPISLAIKGLFPNREPYVGCHTLLVDNKAYQATDEIKDFVTKFDNGKKVRPTTFKI